MTKQILLFLFLLSALPLIRLQAQTYTHYANGKTWSYTVNGSNATITGASPATGELNIPAKVGPALEYDVTAIRNNAFYNNKNITKLTANSVTTIGNNAFQYCTGLTGNLELPNVTTIGNNAFHECTGLTSLELPSATTLGVTAFSGCGSLTGKLELPNATTLGTGAFNSCRGLTSLELPNVTTIANSVFRQCTGLTGKLELPKIVSIGNQAFEACHGLTDKLELPKTLTNIGIRAFSGTKITAIIFESGTNLANIIWEANLGAALNLQYIDMKGVTFPPSFTTVSRKASFFNYVPPHAIVYLPSSAPAVQSDEENFVINNRCDKFVVYESYSTYQNIGFGCDYPIIYPFTATTAEYRNRYFLGDRNCKTICLPYGATLPNGLRAYKLVAKTRGGKAFRFVSIGDGNGTFKLEANTPYLLRSISSSGIGFLNNWITNNTPVPVTPATIEIPVGDGNTFFGGTTTNIDNATAASNNYYNLYSNMWYPIKTTNTNGYVQSFRAYIRTTGGTPAKGFAMVIDDDENATTDIDNAAELTEDELRSGKHTFYTLDGRRAGTNYDTLKSGEMYVVKGQKFYKF